jgi:hypothetical protein
VNCWTYGVKERCVESFGGENVWEIDHLEVPGIDGRIILKWTFLK